MGMEAQIGKLRFEQLGWPDAVLSAILYLWLIKFLPSAT